MESAVLAGEGTTDSFPSNNHGVGLDYNCHHAPIFPQASPLGAGQVFRAAAPPGLTLSALVTPVFAVRHTYALGLVYELEAKLRERRFEGF